MRAYHTTCGGRKKTAPASKPVKKAVKKPVKKPVKKKAPVKKDVRDMEFVVKQDVPKKTRKPRAKKVKEMPKEVSKPSSIPKPSRIPRPVKKAPAKAPAKKKPVRPSYPPPPPPKKKFVSSMPSMEENLKAIRAHKNYKSHDELKASIAKRKAKARPFLKSIPKAVAKRKTKMETAESLKKIRSHPNYQSFEQLQKNIDERKKKKLRAGGRKRGGAMNPFQPTGNISYSTMRSKL